MKATAVAPSNIAFIKYWGRKNEVLRLPSNGSISMNLSNLTTTTTVEFSTEYTNDIVSINGQQEGEGIERVIKQLDRIREITHNAAKAKVVSENNFPTATGLSSSASGFAALTLAATMAAGLHLSEKDLSILARQGSGSACRSIPTGFVEWLDGDTTETSYAVSLYKPDYFDIVDIVAITDTGKKDVTTSQGHKISATSPFFVTRLKNMPEKIKLFKTYLEKKDFNSLGALTEQEALELHAIYFTLNPSLIYLRPESLSIIKAVQKWRKEGLSVYFTLNTGQDVHIICQKKDIRKIDELLKTVAGVKQTIINFPSIGAHVVDSHLF